MKINGALEVPDEAIAAFCRKWRITELALFGSVLRDDFGPESDVDMLVRFQEPIRWGLFDLVHMEEELAGIFGRPVDVVDGLAWSRARIRFGVTPSVRPLAPSMRQRHPATG